MRAISRALRIVVPAALLASAAVAFGSDAGSSAVRCAGSVATIVGTGGADRLVGTARADVIAGRGGRDVIQGRGGNDKICDGGGNDRVVAGGGNDRVVGGGGNDRVVGGGGKDRIAGGAGKDRLAGGAGDDKLLGNAGADRLIGGAGTDDCRGGPGADILRSCETGDPGPGPGPGPDRPPVAVNDARTVDEDASPQAFDVLANDTDPDGGPRRIASVTQPPNGTVALTGGGTGLTYRPDANYCNSPAQPTDNFAYTLAPGGSTASVAVRVQCVNDKPTITTTSGPRGYSQGSGPQVIDATLDVADVDSANLSGATVAITAGLAASEDELDFTDQLGITGTYDSGTGILTLTGAASVADYQAALRSVTYENTASSPTLGTRTVTFQVTDSSSQASDPATRDIEVSGPNDAPVADDETFDGANSAFGNTTLVVDDPDDEITAPAGPHKAIEGDLLDGDQDADGPGPLTVTPGTFATNDGGSVTIEADGDFIYEPAAGTSCTDTSDFFDYTVEDSHPTDEQTDTGRVTIAITGCVWYVSNNAAGNSGTSVAPFDSLAQAETASGPGHTVFVFDGDDTTTGYATGYAMDSGERLIGEHEGLAVGGESLHPATPGARPTLTATDEDVVSLDDANEIRGFVLDPQGAGGGMAGGAGDSGGGTFIDVEVADSGTPGTQPGVELDGTSGTFTFSNLDVSTSGAMGVRLNAAGTADFGETTIVTSGARALHAAGTSMGTSTFDAITATDSPDGGVRLADTTGTTVFGNGVGTELALSTISGAAPAFALANAGTVSVPASAGTTNVSATGGPAVDITGTTPGTGGFDFDDADSSSSSGDGINLAGLGSGSFSAGAGSSITGAEGVSFDLNGGSGAVTFGGTLGDGAGLAARIAGRSGGAVTLSGSMSDDGDDGGGISMGSNTGGSTTFSGSSKTLNTGSSDAVAFTSNAGHTLNLTGGGLDIDTTGGKGLDAASGAGITVTGSGNTIDTGTGRPLSVTSTTIGAAGLTFQRISSNGASNGINLNTTGSAGGLTVTGTGLAPTGGTIASSTGAGISLSNVLGGVSLDGMNVTGGGDDGIHANGVDGGIDVIDSTVTSNGNAVAEHGLDWTDVRGTSTISGTTVSGSAEHNARISSNIGTHDIDVTGSTFSNNSTTLGGMGLQITGGGSATVNADVTSNTIQGSRDAGFQLSTNAGGAGAMNLNFISNDVLGGNAGAVSGQPGVVISSGDSTDLLALLEENEISGSRGSGLIVGPTTNSTTASSHDVTVQQNTIGTFEVGSGSAEGHGAFLQGNGAATTKIAFKRNLIEHWAQNALRISSGEKDTADAALNQPASADFTVTGNELRNGDATRTDAISLIAGVQSAAAAQSVCADIGGASSLENFFGADRSGANAGDFDLQISERFAATLRFPGFAGDGTSQAAIQSFIEGRNGGDPLTVGLIDNPIENAGGAACAQPALPPGVTP